MSVAIGVDLGTTNSVAGVAMDSGVKLAVNSSGSPVHPSVVYFGESSEILVGSEARLKKTSEPQRTIYSAKRLIGQNFHAPLVQLALSSLPYEVLEGSNSQPVIQIGGRRLSIPDVSSKVLSHLKTLSEQQFGDSVRDAVITVPANFSDAQRQATKEAGALAGLDVLRLINEPTAAALAYGYGHNKDETVVVFDFGGGTFDVSVLSIQQDIFEVLATDGEFFLGGDDIDRVVAEHLASEFARLHNIDPRSRANAMNRLRIAAEEVKKYLSTNEEASGSVDGVVVGNKGEPLSLEFELTRKDFDNLISGYVDKTMNVCRQVMTSAGIDRDAIGAVVLVGGSTRIPLIRQRVAELFDFEPSFTIDPDQVVAHGAALQAAMLSGATLQALPEESKAVEAQGSVDISSFMSGEINIPPSALLLDVAPATMSVVTAGGYVEPIIKKNAPIPIEHTRSFSTAHDNQSAVVIECCRGESRRYEDNELLGTVELEELPPGPRGEQSIDVTFRIDADGILHVRACDARSGQERTAKLNILGAPSDDDSSASDGRS